MGVIEGRSKNSQGFYSKLMCIDLMLRHIYLAK